MGGIRERTDEQRESIAIAHEHYLERGGGEHVADALARTFDADLYAGLVSSDATANDLDPTAICNGLTAGVMKRSLAARDVVYSQAWRHVSALHDYDVIIQSGNNPGWYIPTEDQTIVKYVHSPQRTPYDKWSDGRPGLFTRAYAEAARQLYSETLARPDVFVANSDLVARRIQLYWGIDDSKVQVVYPPTRTSSYGPSHADGDRDYYFTFSRLYPSKRISEIVRAFNQLDSCGHDHRLVVGGDGPARDRLEKLAGESVEFVGYLSEADKRRRLAECKAFIFNAYQEDFGMVPIEAMASGTPVLGVRDGFTQHQILDGRNGYTYDRSDTNIVDAVRHFDANGVAWSKTDIQAFAEQFSLPRFRERMRDVVAEATEAAAIQPDFGAAVADQSSDTATPHALTDGGVD